MRRFHFSLDALLELRIREEDNVKLELAHVQEKINDAQDILNSLSLELKNEQSDHLTKREDKRASVVQMRYSVSFRHRMKSELLKQGQYIDRLHREAIHIRENLTKARQQTRTVEMLKEKRFHEWKKEYNRQTQIQMDDISQNFYMRDKRKNRRR